MNLFSDVEAVVRFENNSFVILQKGSYVRCALSKQKIPIDELLYWNHELQEAYANPEIAMQRYQELNGKSQ